MDKVIRHNNMVLTYIGETMEMKKIMPGENQNGFTGEYKQPNFSMTVAGHDYGLQEGINSGGSNITWQSGYVGSEFKEDGGVITYFHEALKLQIELHFQFAPGTDIIRQYNVVKNMGEEDQVLTHFSSTYLAGVGTDGILPWDDLSKYRIHFCHSTWQGEGQWKTINIEEAGLCACSIHDNHGTFQLSSIGSWSSGRFYPVIMFEDIETHQIWYAQIETSSAWHFEIGHRKLRDGAVGQMYLLADGADENTSGWAHRLKPGESFTTATVAYGCTNGGFEEAVGELVKYRRTCLKAAPAWKGEFPLMFNDYMNALWADPTTEVLIPLIDAAAEAGAEGFCVDAGWFGNLGENWGLSQGDWIPSKDRFGEAGFKSIADYIKSKGMRAGFWIEFESCCSGSQYYKNPDDHFLMRHGKRIGGYRGMLDFRNKEVRAFMHGIFDTMCDMGFSFVKNDYNQTTALGDDKYTESAADGLLEHTRAVYSFLDELRERHPDLIIENCGSGGLRGDWGMVSRCHFQNTSDQEIYWKYPSLIQGYIANLTPEQATIWSFPWPHLFTERGRNTEYLASEEYRAQMADGEQTVFNMVNGCAGAMLLSGHIDYADEFNMNLIKEGTAYYKSIRKYIEKSLPVFPKGAVASGMTPINRKDFTVLGLNCEEAGKMLLYVWRIDSEESTVDIDLSKYFTEIKNVRIAYPSCPKGVTLDADNRNRKVSVHFSKNKQARIIEIDYLK